VLTLDSIVVWQVVLLSASSGAMWSILQTAQQSYTFDVVGAEDAAAGLALGTLALRIGGVGGALAAGIALNAWGPGETYIALKRRLPGLGAVILLARTKGQAAPATSLPLRQNLREYAGELRRNKTLAWLIVLMVAAEIFGFSHYSAMPILIRDELGGDGGDLGVASALASTAGIIAILLFSARSQAASTGLAFLAILVAYGASVILLGQTQRCSSPWPWPPSSALSRRSATFSPRCSSRRRSPTRCAAAPWYGAGAGHGTAGYRMAR
jgi:hypothetical protein